MNEQAKLKNSEILDKKRPKGRRFLKTILVVTLALLVLGILTLRVIPALVPYGANQALEDLSFSRVYLDRNGSLLQIRPLEEGLRRIYLPLADYSPILRQKVLEAEDRRFYWHPGFDPLSILRALGQNLLSGQIISGASTISMQVASLLSPRPNTMSGKVLEIWDALQLESRLSKDQIFEYYLALVPFGKNIQGYQAAGYLYYDVPAGELNQNEIDLLVKVPRSPSTFDPWANPQSFDSMEMPIRLRDNLTDDLIWPFKAPHYVNFLEQNISNQDWEKGLIPIKTTLDPILQNSLEATLENHVNSAGQFRISNGAGILVNPETREILAYVGSTDFWDDGNSGQIDGIQIQRQPGSTLKPFLYALALENGFTASTILPDIPQDFGGAQIYTPSNFNEQYNGPIRLRQALAASLNLPAVYTLYRLGVQNFANFLGSFDFDSLDDQLGSVGLSLALGGAEVRLYELVQAFLTFYHKGEYAPLIRVNEKPHETGSGNRQILAPAVAQIIENLLGEHPDRVMTFGRTGPFWFGYPVAIKTGTSNQFNNIWALAYTSDLAGGIWMGNFDGRTVMSAPGSSLPASVLNELFYLHSSKTALPESIPLVERRICRLSGKLATDHCPHVISEYFRPDSILEECDWHLPNGGLELPQEYEFWSSQYRYTISTSNQSRLSVVEPRSGSVFFLDPLIPPESQALKIQVLGTGSAQIILGSKILFEGNLPWTGFWPLERGNWRIQVISETGIETSEFLVN